MIRVYYTEKMVAMTDSSSPSARKPQEVVASWMSRFNALSIVDPPPVTIEQLCLAHDPDYVEGILSCKIKNGFYNRSIDVASSLPYTSGAMLAAGREAITNGKVAVAPCSGFHHAGWNFAEGYCTFNGLVVTAMVLKTEGVVDRVGILDFDQHYGNGTENIIDHLGLNWITHYTAKKYFSKPSQAETFLDLIPDIVKAMAQCDVVLYQAGADPHVDDPLGGWLTTDQLKIRDHLVFLEASKLGLPVAWNLAGGYQQPLRRVLDIHDQTMEECLTVYRSD